MVNIVSPDAFRTDKSAVALAITGLSPHAQHGDRAGSDKLGKVRQGHSSDVPKVSNRVDIGLQVRFTDGQVLKL